MITFTQLYTQFADTVGIPATASAALTYGKQNINQANRIFKNASRRYWTRKEVATDLIVGQQYYTFPEDMVRVTTVRVQTGALILPIVMVDSEELWNRLNLIPAMTVGTSIYGFIRGRNELGLYPIPSTAYTGGLIVSYESRLRDMSIDDVTPNVNVVNGSNIITASSGTPFKQNMLGMWFSVTDGSDGNWYQVTGYTGGSQITLENYYQGPTGSALASVIGSAPDIPEDYHLSLHDYACYRYYLKRKDAAMAADFKSLYDDALRRYKEDYSAKTTGFTQPDLGNYEYNMFNLPPSNVSA